MKYRNKKNPKKRKAADPRAVRKSNKGGPFYEGRYDNLEIAKEIFDPETYELIEGKLYYKESGEEAEPIRGPYLNRKQGRIAPYEKTMFDYFKKKKK